MTPWECEAPSYQPHPPLACQLFPVISGSQGPELHGSIQVLLLCDWQHRGKYNEVLANIKWEISSKPSIGSLVKVKRLQ